MHSITLSFATLTQLAAAIAAVQAAEIHNVLPADIPAAPSKPAAAVKPKAEKAADPSPAPAAAASAPAPAASAPDASAPKADAVDYPTLQKAVFKLAGIDRGAATELLEQFKVKTFKEVPADRWAEALEAVNAKIKAVEAALPVAA